jgi:hypothetical protein
MANADLLLEYLVETRTHWGTRIYGDGRVDEYTDREMTFDGSDFVTRTVPLQWRPLTKLSSDELAQLRHAIQAAHFFTLPAHLEPSPGLKDGTTSAWTITLGGRQHHVTAHEAGADHNAALHRLSQVVQELTAAALQRTGASAVDGSASEIC